MFDWFGKSEKYDKINKAKQPASPAEMVASISGESGDKGGTDKKAQKIGNTLLAGARILKDFAPDDSIASARVMPIGNTQMSAVEGLGSLLSADKKAREKREGIDIYTLFR